MCHRKLNDDLCRRNNKILILLILEYLLERWFRVSHYSQRIEPLPSGHRASSRMLLYRFHSLVNDHLNPGYDRDLDVGLSNLVFLSRCYPLGRARSRTRTRRCFGPGEAYRVWATRQSISQLYDPREHRALNGRLWGTYPMSCPQMNSGRHH